ncbi:helix-turn-helix transcriptional regulator [Compostimonas suwonensis]|uniref:ATP/maltotriose-dependent transcriptional regulator MalT n=1 Tax=Compostimonas suwonensis TaxID=1048394 RepID=A0A2M9BUA8_9MICO|nr:LuxR C-terminal-related transcriptional regulator [Compostimonas suwonensis]PJJ61536.1 ATP/maltotriose-dependent transcriptional regulator MalT [Compostimonas suwonensis]
MTAFAVDPSPQPALLDDAMRTTAMQRTEGGAERNRSEKLRVVPRLPGLLLQRPRLHRVLDGTAPLVVLSAPKGFGKTTLVAEWMENRPLTEDIAWVSLISRPAGADDFWSVVVDALGIGDSDSVGGRADRPEQRFEAYLRRLDRVLTIVIDDFDQVADHSVDEQILRFSRAFRMVRLIVCVRMRRPIVRMATIDVDAEVITAQALAFTRAESDELFALHGVRMPSGDLNEAAGGWPGALRAAAMASSAPGGHLADGSIRVLAAEEYIRGLFLQLSDPRERYLVAASAVPVSMTHELAAVIADSPEEAAWMFELVRSRELASAQNEFGEAVVRLPPLVRRVLRQELLASFPDQAVEINTRLIAWYAEHGEQDRLLVHTAEAGDWAQAVATLERFLFTLCFSRRTIVVTVLAHVPPEVFAAHPRLALAQALVDHHVRGDAEAGLLHGWLDRYVSDASPDDHIGARISRLRLAAAAGEHEAAAVLAASLREDIADTRGTDPIVAIAFLQLGLAELLAGRAAPALEAFQEARLRARDAKDSIVEESARSYRDLVLALGGRIEVDAPGLEQEGVRVHSGSSPESERLDGVTQALAGLLRADEQLVSGALERLPEADCDDELWMLMTYVRARHALVWGDRAKALGVVSRARTSGRPQTELERVLLTAVESDLLQGIGRFDAARAVLDDFPQVHPVVAHSRMRLELLVGNAAGVFRDVGEGQIPVLGAGMQLYVAAAALSLGRIAEARESMRAVADFVARSGMWGLLVEIPRSTLEQLLALDVFEGADTMRAIPSVFLAQRDAVPLTSREHLVLQHLASSDSIQDVANSLYISVNTVKTQLRSVYRKLNARSRREALENASLLGLLGGRDSGSGSPG